MLVTGHTGFKGAWLSLWLEYMGAQVSGLALRPENPSAFSFLSPWKVRSSIADLRDPDAVLNSLINTETEIIFHLGAQAIMLRGYRDPLTTYSTNVLGTANVLAALRSTPSVKVAIIVTTDKVYASRDEGQPFKEDDPLGASDPYSNSKVCCEFLIDAWRQSFLTDGGPALVAARAGNAIGGGDYGEARLLPDIYRALRQQNPVLLRQPHSRRPWQHVLEPLAGYLLLAEKLYLSKEEVPKAINFGPDPESSSEVAQVVETIFDIWGGGAWETDSQLHPKEASMLNLDSSLASQILGWRPRLNLQDSLKWTLEWWKAEVGGEDLRKLACDQLERYSYLIQD